MNTRNLPESLFYSSSSIDEGCTYTEVPTGNLDLRRALQGKAACWKLPLEKETLHKKTIVLTDVSSAENLFDELSDVLSFMPWLRNQRIKCWMSLLNQGFKIYAWTGELVQIKNYNDLKEALPSIAPIHPDALRIQLANQGISKKQTFLADFESTKAVSDPQAFIGHPFISLNVLSKLPIQKMLEILASLPDKPQHPISITNISESKLEQLLQHESVRKELARFQLVLDEMFAEKVTLMTLITKFPELKFIKAVNVDHFGNSDLSVTELEQGSFSDIDVEGDDRSIFPLANVFNMATQAESIQLKGDNLEFAELDNPLPHPHLKKLKLETPDLIFTHVIGFMSNVISISVAYLHINPLV